MRRPREDVLRGVRHLLVIVPTPYLKQTLTAVGRVPKDSREFRESLKRLSACVFCVREDQSVEHPDAIHEPAGVVGERDQRKEDQAVDGI